MKERNARVSIVTGFGLLGALLLAAVVVPSAEASPLCEQPIEHRYLCGGGGGEPDPDWCNGTVEADGCQYVQNGQLHWCNVWVAGNCVVGG